MYECVIEIVIVNDRLKCQLSGGTLHGSESPLNLIKRHLCCVVDQKPHIHYMSMDIFVCMRIYMHIGMCMFCMHKYIYIYNNSIITIYVSYVKK